RTMTGGALIPGPGLGRLFEDASHQRAGRIGLFNTDPLLREVDVASIADSRVLGLAPYNHYREHCCFPRVRKFEHISADRRVSGALRDLYRSVDDVDLYVGLFAEEPGSPDAILPPLLTKIIAIDAFSQALTNPLLAPRVFNAATFSPTGVRVIAGTRTLADVVRRNTPEDPTPRFVSMARQEFTWPRPGRCAPPPANWSTSPSPSARRPPTRRPRSPTPRCCAHSRPPPPPAGPPTARCCGPPPAGAVSGTRSPAGRWSPWPPRRERWPGPKAWPCGCSPPRCGCASPPSPPTTPNWPATR